MTDRERTAGLTARDCGAGHTIVVGAGLAGLSAARVLAQAGKSVRAVVQY